jgi:hypothetical protein
MVSGRKSSQAIVFSPDACISDVGGRFFSTLTHLGLGADRGKQRDRTAKKGRVDSKCSFENLSGMRKARYLAPWHQNGLMEKGLEELEGEERERAEAEIRAMEGRSAI